MLAPASVKLPEPDFTNAPVPAITPCIFPTETVRTAAFPSVTRDALAPSSVPMEAVKPLRLSVPSVTVPRVATPPTVVIPPLTVEARRDPPTVTTPALTPPLVISALLANLVLPSPDKLPTVMVPLVALKRRLLAAVFALLTAPSVPPAPVKEAVALPVLRVRLAPVLKSTAARDPPLTLKVAEFASAPVPAVSVPALIWVAPEYVFTPESVTLPEPDLVNAAAPDNMALTLPEFKR